MNKSLQISKAAKVLARSIRSIGEQRAWEEARELVEYAFDISKPVEDLVRYRITSGIPVAYITSKAYFWNLELVVDSSVLIPRPCSEILVEMALKSLNGRSKPLVVDFGTGSGCLLLSTLNDCHQASGIGKCHYITYLALVFSSIYRH